VTHVGASVRTDERHDLANLLTPAQLQLFRSMHPADQRHGLDVAARLREDGWGDPELLVAGLLHDAGKGRSVGLWHRVGWSLGERYGRGMRTAWGLLPGFGSAFGRLDRHAESSAALALAAGCSDETADLIRCQAAPRSLAGEALHRADEAS
jgi:hypothetical protein